MSEKPKPKRPAKRPAMPQATRERAELAKQRMAASYTVPGFIYDGDSTPSCPFREEDRDHWQWLLAEALGSRSLSVMQTFLEQLTPLCADEYKQGKGWEPNPRELNTLIAICAAAQPENEMQAAIAVQMCGLHISAMKLAAVSGRFAWGADERSAATQARVSKAFATLARTLAQLQGKAHSRHEMFVTYYDQRQQTVVMGGGAEIGGQPQASKEIDLVPQFSGRRDARRPALPSPCQDNGQGVSLASGQGEAALPYAWLGARIWRAIRGG